MTGTSEFAVEYKQANKKGEIIIKQKNFGSERAMNRWLAAFPGMDGALEILSIRGDSDNVSELHSAAFYCAKRVF